MLPARGLQEVRDKNNIVCYTLCSYNLSYGIKYLGCRGKWEEGICVTPDAREHVL
jgi:hypothetical protein